MDYSDFAGCWKMTGYEFWRSDGVSLPLWGENPVASTVFDDKGNFSAQIMHDGREPFEGANPTTDEAAGAYRSYSAYFGHFDLDVENQRMTNHVEGCLNPGWVGTTQTRELEVFEGDRMVLLIPPIQVGDVVIKGRCAWKRVT